MKKISLFLFLVMTSISIYSNELQVTSKYLDEIIQVELSDSNIREYFQGYIIQFNDFKAEAPWARIHLDSNYKELIFTYRNHMFFFLCENTEKGDEILDGIVIEQLNEYYTISSGPVEINNDYFDWDIHVLITGPWENGMNENIKETYKSNLEILRIEKKIFESVRLHPEV